MVAALLEDRERVDEKRGVRGARRGPRDAER